MNIGTKILASVAAMLVASTVQAGLIVNSIDMLVAKTDYRVTSESTFFEAMTAFDSALESDPVCIVSLDVFDAVGGKQLCGGPRQDTGTDFFITGVNEGTTQLQFGLDWGRGGYSAIQQGGAPTSIVQHLGDTWWARNWGHSDVLSFDLNLDGAFSILLRGFEGCCNGENSARWRTEGGDWQVLQVNSSDPASAVPVPSALSLLVIGLAVAGYSRRKPQG